MKQKLLVGMVMLAGFLGSARGVVFQNRSTASVPSTSASSQQAVLDQYCVTCHNDRTRSAGLTLDKVDPSRVGENAELWEKVVRKLRAGVMPPAGVRRPDPATYEALTAWLESELDRHASANLNPGTKGVHRLNRNEYANAIRDLLGLDVDVAALLPADDSNYGFDNIASALSFSPALLEAYLSAAARISQLAVGDWTVTTEKAYVPPTDTTQNYHIEGLPFGTRGGMLVRHYFPADGEYMVRIYSLNVGNTVKGEKLEISLNGQRVQLLDWDAQEVVSGTDGRIENHMEMRLPVKAGMHSVGVAFVARNYVPQVDLNKHFLRSTLENEAVTDFQEYPHIGYVLIVGPYNSSGAAELPSRTRIFSCRPAGANQEMSCAKEIISTLARRAYRRPVSDMDLEVLLQFYEEGRESGGFDEGIEVALQRILASPEFIFRIENEPTRLRPGEIYRISDVELASRLSFFLWSSIPDDELLTVATEGKLKDPKVLEQQVRRMLADPRSLALVSNFAGQWLNLRTLQNKAPIAIDFPDFEDNLRQAFLRETELFFESIVREDRNVIDLLTADYTFVNERLARHYGIPNIYGPHFRRVTLGENLEARRGLLGQGSLLLATSLPDRTSPVQRGKWILENVLGTQPPEPPPNVPALEDSKQVGTAVSLRQTMEQHRRNPACAGCHKIMDPIGFSLENFDAIGKWRSKDGSTAIDASGELVDGARVDGPVSLRNALLRYSGQYVRILTEKLLTYAVGRKVEYYDMPVVRSIVRESERSDYRFSTIIMGIVKSAPFQEKRKAQQSVAE